MNKITLEWFIAAMTRALKTIAQTALGMFTVGMAINEVNWTYVLSVSLVAGLYSLLTSFATGLPEVGKDGTLLIDQSNPEKDIYRLNIDTPMESLSTMKTVKLAVDNTARLSQE